MGLLTGNHKGGYWGFSHLAEAWYAESTLARADYVDDVVFGVYHPDGGTSGEMAMRWYPLSGEKHPTARLEVFRDAWPMLALLDDLLKELAQLESKAVSPREFCDLLMQLGFRDDTPRKFQDEDDR